MNMRSNSAAAGHKQVSVQECQVRDMSSAATAAFTLCVTIRRLLKPVGTDLADELERNCSVEVVCGALISELEVLTSALDEIDEQMGALRRLGDAA